MKEFLKKTGLSFLVATWLGVGSLALSSCEKEEDSFPDYTGNYILQVNETYNTCMVMGMNIPRGNLGLMATTFNNNDEGKSQMSTGGLLFCGEIDDEGFISGGSLEPYLEIEEDYTIEGKLGGTIFFDYMNATLIMEYDIDRDGNFDCRTENILIGPKSDLYDCNLEDDYVGFAIEEGWNQELNLSFEQARLKEGITNPWYVDEWHEI
ncbi:MAG: hypothetical protein ABIF40_03460 [archaeon]